MATLRHIIAKTHEKIKGFRGKVSFFGKRDNAAASVPPTRFYKSEPPKEKVQIYISAGTMAKFISLSILFYLLTLFLYEISDI
ncbi:MAG: hypothetical protein Q7R62_03035, partial [bacterium]|nr:hypothetical protein [bacterium]